MMRLKARVSGRIQMTGRRARVFSLARGFGLAGLIQNLPDGRVEVGRRRREGRPGRSVA